jgi:transcriptional regulator with XRE-family HTH domain
MSDLPEGWDLYDPDDHELSRDADYQRARQAAAERAERRRGEYGKALAAMRRARSLTQVALASQLGVAQGEVSRIEHQNDLLISTLARYVAGAGGTLSISARFTDETIELDGTEQDFDDDGNLVDAVIASDPAVVAELGALLGRYDAQEVRFRAAAA